MRTYYEIIKVYLTEVPVYRERKNKNGFIAMLIQKEHNAWRGISTDELERIVVEVSTIDRIWRQVLQENPELRGSDYKDKNVLEQEKILELGYQPGVKRVMEKIENKSI